MHILMVNLGYAPDEIGGAEVAVRTLAHALVGQGARVTVAALSSRGQDWDYDNSGVRVHFLAAHPMGNLHTNPKRTLPQRVLWNLLAELSHWSRDKLVRLVSAEQPDLIHTHNLMGLSTSAWAIARDRRIPSVHTLHGYNLICPRGTMFRARHPCPRQCSSCRIATFARRRASGIPRAVVGNSAFTLNVHLSAGYFPHARHYVIPNAPRPAAASPRTAAEATEKARTPGPARPICIGYLGRLPAYKGPGLLLEALTRLPRHGWVAKIAGTGLLQDVRALKQYAQHRDLPVSFLGWSDPEVFLSEIDLLVVPSLIAEPQGMGVLEAISRHVPVVYANSGGLAEIAASVPGTVPFVAGSADDLGRVLQGYVSYPAELVSLRQLTYVPHPLCDVERFASRYCAVYAESIGVGRSSRPQATKCRPPRQNRLDERG